MAITIGQKLGPHEITALLGKGGMGEVYRARDTRLNRDVAIKVLPDAFASDPERIARFHREAQSVAALNHPNIGAIYDVEEADGAKFLVLELVEGETLADFLQRGRLPLEETLNVAHQICEALEAAHQKGVIHRDLKPANVKITQDGKVKVLDFGLAKAFDSVPASGNLSYSPTLTVAGTQAGVILGTAAYMSPEQAKGFNTDQRSDVFSFGCVLYEMLTGRATFDGDTVSDVLASVLKSEPDFSLLPDNLNPRIRNLLRRCLEKNPRRRWYAIGDVRLEIENIRANPMAEASEQPVPVVLPKPSWKRVVPVLLATLILGVVAGVSVWYFKPSTPLTITRFAVSLAEGQQFTNTGRSVVAISRDGTQIIYVANRALYHRSMQELEARLIPGTDTHTVVLNPVFSPDGRSVVFFAGSDATLKRIAVTGGAAVTICPADGPFGMSWGTEGILFGQGSKGIMKVSENGGKPELIVSLKNDELAHGPQMLPGGKAVLFTLTKSTGTDQWEKAQIVVQTVKSGERKTLIEGGSDARYLPTGHIVYAFNGTLFAVPFDLARMQVMGGQVPVVEGVRRAGVTGTAQFSFSDTGSLIYVPGPISSVGAQLSLVLMDRKGTLETRKVPPKAYEFPRVSPDGKRIALGIEDGKDANVWIYDLAGTSAIRQLTVGGVNRYPIWSADNQRVAFQSDREGDLAIFWQRADGSGTAERLTKPERGVAHIPDSWSPESPRFSFTAIKGPESTVRIYSLQDKKDTLFAQMPSAGLRWSAFSPDGHWLAYQSNETGRNQIWVQPFPATGAKFPIVGGGHPFWSPDGKELFYNSGANQTSVVSITTRPTVTFGVAAPVPGGIQNRNPNTSPRGSDITPDGKYFVGVLTVDQTQTGSAAVPQIQFVLNWFEDLKQRMSNH
jgi:eukaryotic-like serine/threonine-protein kinase